MQVFVNIKPAARILATGTALSLIFGSAAMAADANAVAERIKTLYAKQGGELNFANVQANGSDIVLQGTKIKLPTVGEKETALGDVTLQNVQDAPDGGYTIEQVTVPDLAFAGQEDKNDKAEIKGLAMQNVYIPSETAKGPLDSMVLYDKMKIDDGCYELRVTDASGNVLKVKIDPATLEVVDGSVKRFGDGSTIGTSPETELD